MPAPTAIDQLITRFHDDRMRRLSSYNETEARIHNINPLFAALGWDVGNALGRAEVKHEDKVAVGGQVMAPGDVFTCAPTSLGATTVCPGISRFYAAAANGLPGGADIDGLEVEWP